MQKNFTQQSFSNEFQSNDYDFQTMAAELASMQTCDYSLLNWVGVLIIAYKVINHKMVY